VCLLGEYGSSGMGFCPGKEKTNLECSKNFYTICKRNDNKQSVDDL
jgi:hypothetical protein